MVIVVSALTWFCLIRLSFTSSVSKCTEQQVLDFTDLAVARCFPYYSAIGVRCCSITAGKLIGWSFLEDSLFQKQSWAFFHEDFSTACSYSKDIACNLREVFGNRSTGSGLCSVCCTIHCLCFVEPSNWLDAISGRFWRKGKQFVGVVADIITV